MADKNYLLYKGKPLVRSGNKLYYGNMADGYVIEMTLHDIAEEHGISVSKRITIRLVCTMRDCPPAEMIVNKSEKNNLADALEIAEIWLSRKLNDIA